MNTTRIPSRLTFWIADIIVMVPAGAYGLLAYQASNQGTMGGAFYGVRWMCFFEFYFKKMEFVKSPLLYALKASQ